MGAIGDGIEGLDLDPQGLKRLMLELMSDNACDKTCPRHNVLAAYLVAGLTRLRVIEIRQRWQLWLSIMVLVSIWLGPWLETSLGRLVVSKLLGKN